MFKSIESINEEIENIYNKIKQMNLIINKKEDDIKNIISEKDEIIAKLNIKINEQEDIIKENKNEISDLNKKIEEILNNMTNQLKNKDNKLNEIENKLSTLNKEKNEDMNKLITQVNKQRLDILNKISNEFSKLHHNELKKNYRIIVFGETGTGKSQFCNFVIRDKTNSVYRVKDSFDSYRIDYSQSEKFNRLGVNFELIDTLGFDSEYRNDYLRNYSEKLKNIDYIILILSFQNKRFHCEISKFVERLIKIFTADKFYNHFCIVFTHCYSFNKRIIERKEAIIKTFNLQLKDLFQDKNKNFQNKLYFVDTEIDDEDEENTFNEKSQEIIDIMLNQIKLDIDFLGSIN